MVATVRTRPLSVSGRVRQRSVVSLWSASSLGMTSHVGDDAAGLRRPGSRLIALGLAPRLCAPRARWRHRRWATSGPQNNTQSCILVISRAQPPVPASSLPRRAKSPYQGKRPTRRQGTRCTPLTGQLTQPQLLVEGPDTDFPWSRHLPTSFVVFVSASI